VFQRALQQFQVLPLTPAELSRLEKEARDTYNKPRCKEFIQSLLKKVSGDSNPPDIMDLFNTIKVKGGFAYGNNRIGEGETYGSIGKGNVLITFLPGSLFVPTSQGPTVDGIMVMHEVSHAMGPGYDDRAYALAAHDVALELGYDLTGKTPLPKRQSDYPNEEAWVKANSSYYEARMQAACGYGAQQ
jgi:hypothetical protein